MSDVEPEDVTPGYVTYCPECEAQFGPEEEGFDYENCIECGAETYEIPG